METSKFSILSVTSDAEPEQLEAATFRVEPEPIFLWPEREAVPTASFWQAKKKSLVLVSNMT